jgi:hypothetical protein
MVAWINAEKVTINLAADFPSALQAAEALHTQFMPGLPLLNIVGFHDSQDPHG